MFFTLFSFLHTIENTDFQAITTAVREMLHQVEQSESKTFFLLMPLRKERLKVHSKFHPF